MEDFFWMEVISPPIKEKNRSWLEIMVRLIYLMNYMLILGSCDVERSRFWDNASTSEGAATIVSSRHVPSGKKNNKMIILMLSAFGFGMIK